MEASAVIECLRKQLPAILESRPVLLAYAHGSLVANTLTPHSDVDIALVLRDHEAMSAYQRMRMELEIEAEIEEACDIKTADVRNINDAPLRVQGRILTQGVILYSADEDARVAFEVATRRRYFDFKPVLDMMQESYFERLRR